MAERKVLIVEDDVDFASTLALPLQLRKHSVQVAHSGSEAIALTTREAFDVCFLDIKMPGMSGIECLRKIRALLPPGTQFIMMTGFREEALLAEARQAGAREVLLKPFKMLEFLRCVEADAA